MNKVQVVSGDGGWTNNAEWRKDSRGRARLLATEKRIHVNLLEGEDT